MIDNKYAVGVAQCLDSCKKDLEIGLFAFSVGSRRNKTWIPAFAGMTEKEKKQPREGLFLCAGPNVTSDRRLHEPMTYQC
jgi:hypothetical protein